MRAEQKKQGNSNLNIVMAVISSRQARARDCASQQQILVDGMQTIKQLTLSQAKLTRILGVCKIGSQAWGDIVVYQCESIPAIVKIRIKV